MAGGGGQSPWGPGAGRGGRMKRRWRIKIHFYSSKLSIWLFLIWDVNLIFSIK